MKSVYGLLGILLASSVCLSSARDPQAPTPIRLELEAEPVVATVCQALPLQLRLRNTSNSPIAIVWPGANSLAFVPYPSLEWSVIDAETFSTAHRPGQRVFHGRSCPYYLDCTFGQEWPPERIFHLNPGEALPILRTKTLAGVAAGTDPIPTITAMFGPRPPGTDRHGIVRVMAYAQIGYVSDTTQPLALAEDGHLIDAIHLRTAQLRSNEVSLRVFP